MMAEESPQSASLSDLPIDELIVYGRKLGLTLDETMAHGELLRLVRERQALLGKLDRESMLRIVVWARRPVRKSASKEDLAKEIATIKRMSFGGLADGDLATLARLRQVAVHEGEPRELLERRIKLAEPFWDRVRRHRRRAMGSIISRLVDAGEEDEDYRFLPEQSEVPSLKERIREQGVVGGIAHTLRGVADDYVAEKLDEIEARIDRKLDEIDQRLAEWRDREIANRLKIIKITLVASILVALLSLGYHYLTSQG